MAPPPSKPSFKPFVEETDEVPKMWVDHYNLQMIMEAVLIRTTCYLLSFSSCFISCFLLGLRVRSTQQWTKCCRSVNPAWRKRLWRGCRNRRRRNQEKRRSRACTLKSCCSVEPLSSALKNCALNAILKRWLRRAQVRGVILVPALQSDASSQFYILLYLEKT